MKSTIKPSVKAIASSALAILATFSTAQYIHSPTPCVLTYVSSDGYNQTTGTALPGCEKSFSFQTTITQFVQVAIADPGCCGNIIFPTCTQPVPSGVTGTYSQTLSHTTTQTQNDVHGITLGNLWRLLTNFTWNCTTTNTWQDVRTQVASLASKTVNCSDKSVGYLSDQFVHSFETRQDANKKSYTRDQVTEIISCFYKDMLTWQSYDPCTDTFTTLLDPITHKPQICKPISMDGNCAKVIVH